MQEVYSIRRCYFTLLEVLIALTLAAVLITVVVYFYQQLSLINIRMDQTQNENFQKRFAEYRLNAVIPQIVSPSNKDFYFFISQNAQALFMENSQSLVFTFDNDVKLDKKMADLVIGRLYLDDMGRFTLATWPIPRRWKENEPPPMNKEIIMENVAAVTFEFFHPPNKGPLKIVNKQENGTPPPRKNENSRKRDAQKLPAIIKIVIQRKIGKDKVEEMLFAYPLPNTQQPIIYTQ